MVSLNTLRSCVGNQVFLKMHFKLVTSVDLKKCLKHIKLPILLDTCAPTSKLPSNISTMINSDSPSSLRGPLLENKLIIQKGTVKLPLHSPRKEHYFHAK